MLPKERAAYISMVLVEKSDILFPLLLVCEVILSMRIVSRTAVRPKDIMRKIWYFPIPIFLYKAGRISFPDILLEGKGFPRTRPTSSSGDDDSRVLYGLEGRMGWGDGDSKIGEFLFLFAN